jgi:hypothetical protein
MKPHIVEAVNAAKIAEWLFTRGGIAIWESVNLSNPGASWTTPLNDENGQPKPKPTWQAGDEPARIITDPGWVHVVTPKEVKRFHVAIRATGPFGMTLKCTDGASRRIRKAVDKANEKLGRDECWYSFDYETQEAVIYAPGETVQLSCWRAE